MEGVIGQILREVLKRTPEGMRKLFYTDSFAVALSSFLFLCGVFAVTQLGVSVFGKVFPEYAHIAEGFFEYLGFLPTLVFYRLLINPTAQGKEPTAEDEKVYWKGYWEAVRMHGKSAGVVKTSLGTVVIYKVKGYPENPYDITPVGGEEDNIDLEAWEKLYWSFRKFGIGKDPKEVLANL